MARKALSKNTVEAVMGICLFVLWAVCRVVLEWVVPQYDFDLFVFVPILFFVFAIAFIFTLNANEKQIAEKKITAQKSYNRLMMLRMIKMVVSVVAMFLYIKLIGVNNYSFFVTFGLFYFMLLGLEAFAISNSVKREKEAKELQD